MSRGSMFTFDVQSLRFNVEHCTLNVERFGMPTAGREERWLKA